MTLLRKHHRKTGEKDPSLLNMQLMGGSTKRTKVGQLFTGDNSHDRESVKKIITALRKLDAQVSVRSVIKNETLPFCIEKTQVKLISKSLSMALRAAVDRSLYTLWFTLRKKQFQ